MTKISRMNSLILFCIIRMCSKHSKSAKTMMKNWKKQWRNKRRDSNSSKLKRKKSKGNYLNREKMKTEWGNKWNSSNCKSSNTSPLNLITINMPEMKTSFTHSLRVTNSNLPRISNRQRMQQLTVTKPLLNSSMKIEMISYNTNSQGWAGIVEVNYQVEVKKH